MAGNRSAASCVKTRSNGVARLIAGKVMPLVGVPGRRYLCPFLPPQLSKRAGGVVVKTGSIATKVALVVSAVVVAALALVGVFALRSSDKELVRLQLDQASRRLNTNLAIAERIFEERFPGEWRLADGAPVGFGQGSQSESLTTHLYKGETPILANPEVTALLLEVARLTGTELSFAQRLPDNRVLLLATSDTGSTSARVLTVMRSRDPSTGEPVAAGLALMEGEPVFGRSTEGEDDWTLYRTIRAGNDIVGVFYAATPYGRFAESAAAASRSV